MPRWVRVLMHRLRLTGMLWRLCDGLGVTALLSHMIEMPSHDREAGVVMAA